MFIALLIRVFTTVFSRYFRFAIASCFWDRHKMELHAESENLTFLRASQTRCSMQTKTSVHLNQFMPALWMFMKAKTTKTWTRTRMWANAQRDGRPAEHRWRPLFNAAKFGWRPLLDCRAVTLPRRETRWNLQGCLEPANRSQPLVDRSSPYCGHIWRTYCCF